MKIYAILCTLTSRVKMCTFSTKTTRTSYFDSENIGGVVDISEGADARPRIDRDATTVTKLNLMWTGRSGCNFDADRDSRASA
jgi:hypothetical protein